MKSPVYEAAPHKMGLDNAVGPKSRVPLAPPARAGEPAPLCSPGTLSQGGFVAGI